MIHDLIKNGRGDAGRQLAWADMAKVAQNMIDQLGKLEQLHDASKIKSSTEATQFYLNAKRTTLLLVLRLTLSLAGPSARH